MAEGVKASVVSLEENPRELFLFFAAARPTFGVVLTLCSCRPGYFVAGKVSIDLKQSSAAWGSRYDYRLRDRTASQLVLVFEETRLHAAHHRRDIGIVGSGTRLSPSVSRLIGSACRRGDGWGNSRPWPRAGVPLLI